MKDNILYHMPQEQQAYKPSSQPIPPKNYEQQYSNPKYYQANMNNVLGSQTDKQQDDVLSLNQLQKEFLKNEYQKQQDEQRRKKDDNVRQRENDLQTQQQLNREYQQEVEREKLYAADKKRAMAELYKAQIEQSQRDKAQKKQMQIEEDRARLQMQDDGKRDNTKLRQQTNNPTYQIVNDNRSQLQQQQDYNRRPDYGHLQPAPQFEIGGENVQQRQQIEKYERQQEANVRNYVSYDDEKKRKADLFSQAGGNSSAPYGGPNRQYNAQMSAQQMDKKMEQRDYNESLKRQMVENDLRKQQEKQDRQKGYDFDSVSNPGSIPQRNGPVQGYQQSQNQNQRSKLSSQQDQYDIMGNQRNVYQANNSKSGDSKREDQLRYRELLDMQTEQNKLSKQREEEASYQPSQQYQQPPTNQSGKSKAQLGQEYDVMGNQKNPYVAYGQNNQGNQKRDDQLKYKEMLDLQREQTRIQKMQDDEMTDLEKKYNGSLNLGPREPLGQQQQQYQQERNRNYDNPYSNQYEQYSQKNDENRYQGNQGQNGKGSQQRIDYSALANKNILQNNY